MVSVSHVAENANMACIEDFDSKDDSFIVELLTKQGLQKLVDIVKPDGVVNSNTLLLFLMHIDQTRIAEVSRYF